VSEIQEASNNGRFDLERAGINEDAVRQQHARVVAEEQSPRRALVDRLPVVGGAVLLGWGLSRRSWPGVVTAGAGGGAVYYGIRRGMARHASSVPDGERSIRVEKVITVNRSIEEVYDAWSDVTSLPRILSHLRSVTEVGAGKTHWVANAPLGKTVEWDAETMVDQENRVISWRSVGDATVPNVGAVRFQEAPGKRGTEVRVRIEYTPPLGQLGATFAKLFGEEPGMQVEDDLRRFKAMLETGEVPTTNKQSRGGPQQSRMDSAIGGVRRLADAAASVTGTR
jgi:uncharacterized membrane protein